MWCKTTFCLTCFLEICALTLWNIMSRIYDIVLTVGQTVMLFTSHFVWNVYVNFLGFRLSFFLNISYHTTDNILRGRQSLMWCKTTFCLISFLEICALTLWNIISHNTDIVLTVGQAVMLFTSHFIWNVYLGFRLSFFFLY